MLKIELNRLYIFPIVCLLSSCSIAAPQTPNTSCGQANEGLCSLSRLQSAIPTFKVQSLSSSGEVILNKDTALTVDKIRGIALDPNPPVVKAPATPYPESSSDSFPPTDRPYGTYAPYVAKDIKPFRFKYFRNEMNYAGTQLNRMKDYASAHGFSVVLADNNYLQSTSHLPVGTELMTWKGFATDGISLILADLGIPSGHFEALASVTDDRLNKAIASRHTYNPKLASYMIDLEFDHANTVEAIKQLSFFPKDKTAQEQQKFIKDYFKGVERSYSAQIKTARGLGFKRLGIYGWSPYPSTFFLLNNDKTDPQTNEQWVNYGEEIYKVVDVIHPSVYLYYPEINNLAYIMANIDRNRIYTNYMNSKGTPKKPIVPYFWNLFHGGDNQAHWWRYLPIANEDARAMTAFSLFTGIDGIDMWGFSGGSSPHAIEFSKTNYFPTSYNSVKDSFNLPAPSSGTSTVKSLKTFDAIKVVKVDSARQTVKFQVVDKKLGVQQGVNSGIATNAAVFTMATGELSKHLRPQSETISAAIEGLALAYPFEYFLRNGDVKVDVDASQQWQQSSPVVRRVKKDGIHIIIAYDPKSVYDSASQSVERQVVLNNFDGVNGRNLIIPTSKDIRIYVLKDANASQSLD
jgi:hypothetical protein